MADIDVVKKGSSAWVWVLLALALVAVVLWFVMSGDSTPQAGFNQFDPGAHPFAAADRLFV